MHQSALQDFMSAYTPLAHILAQDNAKWNGGPPALGLECAHTHITLLVTAIAL